MQKKKNGHIICIKVFAHCFEVLFCGFERYLAILNSYKYSKLRSEKKIFKLMAVVPFHSGVRIWTTKSCRIQQEWQYCLLGSVVNTLVLYQYTPGSIPSIGRWDGMPFSRCPGFFPQWRPQSHLDLCRWETFDKLLQINHCKLNETSKFKLV